ncbi:hypothetical protein K493DRAFT_319667 [Basidiobolus meristosporus CBS 931.73]|uniref:LYC1 C-terminal domain-containing protein n=1 Tax=Basidiobolus meristosporus CBS 931.73 TaxID=1314790 RepID=A0A1Y1XP43_9FUNG|nr:hypothetical protein K493DRAFT_319667 [Basidiobolus meristosporus CBS 931.73]|eukprot:ORX87435.1 hypothetical protein K493DRAFT_319667 [Basidiobolus meristosporus CBS 931.73]
MPSSSTYSVIQTNPAQTHQAHDNTHEAWDRNLTPEKFHEREDRLDNCEFARDNLKTYALIRADNPETLDLLSHLEVFIRPALVRFPQNPGQVERVKAASVASVFTPSKYRQNGYAKQLLLGVLDTLRNQGIVVSNLYSDVGPELYSRLGWRVYSPEHLQIEVGQRNIALSDINLKPQPIKNELLGKIVQRDCELLEKEFTSNAQLGHRKPAVLLLPTEPVYHWFWERSNFYATEVESQPKISKLGVYLPGTPYFAIWYPDYLEKSLVVLRIRLPKDDPNAIFEAFMHHAKEEAIAHKLTHVVIWNLDHNVWKGRYDQEPGINWITRTGALSSMAWIPDLSQEVEWYNNEKFCWV